MTTSVVITTYNGEDYIVEQLESIRLQTESVDEVLISDDCSKDKTAEVVEKYILQHQLSTWKLIERKENLGWKRNFIETMKLAMGDIILLADQDDVWYPDKMIEYKKAFFNSDVVLLVSNYDTMYSGNAKDQQSYDRQIAQMKNTGIVKRWTVNPDFHVIDRPGCVYGVRNTFFKSIHSFFPGNHPHDSFLWIAAMVVGGLYLYDAPTIKYRRYANNVIRKKTVKTITAEQRRIFCENELFIVESVRKNVASSKLSIAEENIIEQFVAFTTKRMELFESKNVFRWISIAFKYHSFYASWKSMMADLAVCFK